MTLVMGIVNATPDSFSDGGHFIDPDVAIRHGMDLAAAGAAIVDVGGESTRPGASDVSEADELRRVVDVVAGLAAAGVVVSIDTMRARVARAAVEAGASIVNDVSGGEADPAMRSTVAELGVDYAIMHWPSLSHEVAALNRDVCEVVRDDLARLVESAVSAGVAPDRIIVDPGIGFGKSYDDNWALLRGLDRLATLGHRVLVGASRKRFLGDVLDGREPTGRDVATAAVSMWCALHGVWAVRTHDVSAQLDAIAVAQRLR